MRYTINTTDAEGLIGIQLAKWEKEGKLAIIEKSETLVEIENRLAKVAAALATLRKAGYDSEVMQIYLNKKTGVGTTDLKSILFHQNEFLKQIGALK